MQKILVKIVMYLLKSNKVTGENKNKILSYLLQNIQAIPIRDVIKFDVDGTLKINNRALEMEQAIAFRDSARVLKDNFAKKLIQDQLTYEAIQMGVHQGLNSEMIMFSKCALWLIQEENKLLNDIVID